MKCPHCAANMIVRDSQEVTITVRELRLHCTDDDCGYATVAQLALVRQIRPATRPNPDARLPFGAWSRPANDDHPNPANDTGLGEALADIMST